MDLTLTPKAVAFMSWNGTTKTYPFVRSFLLMDGSHLIPCSIREFLPCGHPSRYKGWLAEPTQLGKTGCSIIAQRLWPSQVLRKSLYHTRLALALLFRVVLMPSFTNIIFVTLTDVTFCGDWAGNSYADSGCPGTCSDRLLDPNNFVVSILLQKPTAASCVFRCNMFV